MKYISVLLIIIGNSLAIVACMSVDSEDTVAKEPTPIEACMASWIFRIKASDQLQTKLEPLLPKIKKYIALKSGADVGAYDFFFFGVSEQGGHFVAYRDFGAIKVRSYERQEAEELYIQLVQTDYKSLQGALGSHAFYHNSCSFLRIVHEGDLYEAVYLNPSFGLETSQQDPRISVLYRVTQYFDKEYPKVDMSRIDLSKDQFMLTDEKMLTKDFVERFKRTRSNNKFYEITTE